MKIAVLALLFAALALAQASESRRSFLKRVLNRRAEGDVAPGISGTYQLADCLSSTCVAAIKPPCEDACKGKNINNCVNECVSKSFQNCRCPEQNYNRRGSGKRVLNRRAEEEDDGLTAAQRHEQAPKLTGTYQVTECLAKNCALALKTPCVAACTGKNINSCWQLCVLKSWDNCKCQKKKRVLTRRAEEDDGLTAAQRHEQAPKLTGTYQVTECLAKNCALALKPPCVAACTGKNINSCWQACVLKSWDNCKCV